MKQLHHTLLLLLVCMLVLSSCADVYHGRPAEKGRKDMPPGQKKKIYGTKSAKPFAPGQQKKRR